MKKQAFSIVELIVTLSIIALLTTIGFISMQGYNEISRDSVRISDLSSIKSGLELYELESGKFPEPTNGVNITYSGSIVWIQGTYGESTGINVDKLGKIPIDPLTEKEYTYSVTLSKKEYNLGGILEAEEVAMNNLLSETNAGETTINALVTGIYNGHMLKALSGTICSVLAIPSIIINDTSTGTDLLEIVNNQKLVYNGYKNLPSSFIGSKFKNDGGFAYIPNKLVVYNDSIGCRSLAQSETERIGLLKNLQDNYSGTILSDNDNYVEFINTQIDLFNPSNASKLISRELVSNNLNLKLNEESLTFLNCEGGIIEGYTYGNVAHGLGESVTKVLSTPNGIKDYGALATCNNGNIQIANENINITCDSTYVEENGLCVPEICNGAISLNAHSTATSQSASITWINSLTPGLCTFACDTNYTWNGTSCEPNTKNTNCTLLPTNAVWNTVNNITQTWTGTNWLPLEIGTYDTNASITNCNFKCDTNYTWNGSECIADIKNTNCTSLPTNAQWNTVNNITQTWDGTNWLPTEIGSYDINESTTQCVFKCNTNYTWNGTSCLADTKPAQECTGKPSNSVYNTATSITQTWNGTTWAPSTISEFNLTPSTTSCNFKCDTNYTWNESICVADTQSTTCGGSIVENATATTATNYTQIWNGTSWTPTTTWGEFQSTCDFDCNANYTWNGIACIADTKPAQDCTGKPSNSIYNTATSITQTWNGTTWAPSTISEFNLTPSTTSCNFKCDTNYTWNESICVADTQLTTCSGSIVENATATTATNYTQIWNGAIWTPTTTWGEFQSTCDFDCNLNYTWNGTSCIANTQIAQACTGKPANSVYNTATNITQTWNGTAWMPSTISTYNTTPSTTTCNFKCDTNYTWNGATSQCDPNNYTVTFDGNGGTGHTPTTKSVTYNTAVGTLPSDPTRTGYAFNGWFTLASGGTQINTSTIVLGTATVYAQWSINSYTATFDGNSGTGHTPTTKSVTYNTAVGALPTNPTRTGYTFNGWFTATSGGTQITTGTIVTGAITYYAQWTINNYTVTFDGNGGTGHTPTTKSVTYNTAVGTLPSDPTRTGYAFNGWFTLASGGTQINTSTIVLGTATVYAQWSINSYTVTFDGNGGTGHTPTTKSVTYNTAVGALPTNPTRTGYTFNGWFTATSGGTQITTGTIVTGAITYYAQWSINSYTVSGSFGANANGATINVCGTNVTAAADGSFTATRNYGSVCNTITATRTNYTCNTTTNGPASLTSNTTNIAGTCTANTQTFTCLAKPAVGTLWNTVTNYQQTWNGTAWLPADTTTSYNITPSTTSCSYTCDTGYFWNSSICESQWSGDAATGYLFKNTSGTAQYPLSCNDLLDNTLFQNTLTGSPWNGTKFNDGVYWIKPITTSAYKAYCNMTTDGGGWTMVLAQYETDAVTNWNEGTQGDYDPTLVTKKGFALNTSQLPEHNQIGIGKDLDSTYIDYVNGIYTTGDSPVTLLNSPKTTYKYHIHRNISNFYGYHDPEYSSTGNEAIWNNTLTVDKTGGISYTWAFAPNHTSSVTRGYAINSISASATTETYAWTIWVRKSAGTFLVGDNGGFHWNNGTYETNCKGYIDSGNYNNEGSGVYWIKPDTNPAFKIYCDMTNNDGGWTLLSNQTSYDGTNVYGASACNSLTGNCGGNLQKLGHTIDRYNKMMIRHANGKYVVFDLKSGGFLEKMFMGQAVYAANYDNVYIYDDNIHNRSGYSDYLGFRGANTSNDSMWLSNYSYNSSNRYTYAFKWASNCASVGYSNGVSVCSSTGGFSIFVKKDNEVLGTVDKPGKSCKEILISGDSTGDGTYWIKPDTNPAFQVYCDMTTDGGGWTLVRKMQSTSIVTGNTSASNASSLVNLSTASANVSDVTWNSLKPLQVWNICNGSQTIYNRNMAVPWYSNHGVADSCSYNRGFWSSMQKNFGATPETAFTYQACGGGWSTAYTTWGVISGIYDSSAYYGCYDLYSTNTTSPAPAKFDNRSGTAIGWGGNGYVLVR